MAECDGITAAVHVVSHALLYINKLQYNVIVLISYSIHNCTIHV